MARHSKWAKVKHFKGAIDAKRGKLFSKLAREVFVAARTGGGDPAMNARLRMALLKCRTASMPKDNIERAIKRATGGEDGAAYEDLTYEVFAPGGVAVLVDLSSDNRNRTSAEIRRIVTDAGGSIATPGAVSRLFQRRGQLIVARDAAAEDALMEAAIEAGAEDFQRRRRGLTKSSPGRRSSRPSIKAVEARGIGCASAELTALPLLTVPVPEVAAARRPCGNCSRNSKTTTM
jgi:YebC/PmpR family DNA-binding regulatory protein